MTSLVPARIDGPTRLALQAVGADRISYPLNLTPAVTVLAKAVATLALCDNQVRCHAINAAWALFFAHQL